MFVPVVDKDNCPLMPTTPSRAKRWIKSGKATPFFKKGVFYVRLNKEPSNRNTQPIAVGVDPGSKGEGFTVKSKMHTYLNIQTHAVDWVKDHLLVHRNMRHARRFRNIPCRQNRKNRLVNKQKLPPSTKARWQWKLRICNWLTLIFPVSTFVVEVILLEFHRCQLHRLQHSTGHIRSRYGGTISAGFKRGSIIKHPKFGFCYVGGWQESPTKKDPSRKTISLHSLDTGKRLTQNALSNDCLFKAYSSSKSTAVKTAVRLSST